MQTHCRKTEVLRQHFVIFDGIKRHILPLFPLIGEKTGGRKKDLCFSLSWVTIYYAQLMNKGGHFMIRLDTDKGGIAVGSNVYTNIAGIAASNCFGVKGMAVRSMTDGLVHLLR